MREQLPGGEAVGRGEGLAAGLCCFSSQTAPRAGKCETCSCSSGMWGAGGHRSKGGSLCPVLEEWIRLSYNQESVFSAGLKVLLFSRRGTGEAAKQ